MVGGALLFVWAVTAFITRAGSLADTSASSSALAHKVAGTSILVSRNCDLRVYDHYMLTNDLPTTLFIPRSCEIAAT